MKRYTSGNCLWLGSQNLFWLLISSIQGIGINLARHIKIVVLVYLKLQMLLASLCFTKVLKSAFLHPLKTIIVPNMKVQSRHILTAKLYTTIFVTLLIAFTTFPNASIANNGYRDPPEEPSLFVNEETERQRLTMEAQGGTSAPEERYQVFAPVFEGQLRSGQSPRSPRQNSSQGSFPRLPPSAAGGNGDGNSDFVNSSNAPYMKIQSPLRELYEQRSGQRLEMFGYEMFGDMSAAPPIIQINSNLKHDTNKEARDLEASIDTAPLGSLADDLVLKSGDKLEVVFSGQRNDRDVHRINAQGLLLIPDFSPIPASGRTLGDLRASVEAQTNELRNTKVNLSIFSIRQISVLVTGHVKKPGKQRLSAFNTLLDAIVAAGGIRETGSLRNIVLRRNGQELRVDLYGLLTDVSPADEDGRQALKLADSPLQGGDVIVIPPIGKTIAIAGDVVRPAIYELDGNSSALSIDEMLKLSGGILATGANRYMKMTSMSDGREEISEVDISEDKSALPQFSAGDILLVERGSGKKSGQIRLSGHTLRPGLHVLAKNATLSKLLSGDQVLGSDVYALAGVLERKNKKNMSPSWKLFSPQSVLDGEFDEKLQEGDVVHLFSRAQIMELSRPSGKPQDPRLAQNPRAAMAQVLTCTAGHEGNIVDKVCINNPELRDKIYDQNIAGLLKENFAFIRGGVRNPGPWPISGNVQLKTIIEAAGGTTRSADKKNIEITHLPSEQNGPLYERAHRNTVDLTTSNGKSSLVMAGDSIQIRQKRENLVAGDTIWIGGEVRRPGTYGLASGETLSGLIKRAGGLTGQAYPAGAILSRARARKAEEARYRSIAMDIEHSIALARERKDDGSPAREAGEEKILLARALADQLRSVKGLGRVGVEARPDVLAADPTLDVVLMTGDRLYIPPRPASVRVAGEVLSPGFMPFRAGKDARDYINEAAGLTFFGDKARTFVLYPDGTAQRLHISNWNHEPVLLPPGSTIVIPRDPRPFDFIQTTRDLSTILANLAITVLFIDDVISN